MKARPVSRFDRPSTIISVSADARNHPKYKNLGGNVKYTDTNPNPAIVRMRHMAELLERPAVKAKDLNRDYIPSSGWYGRI